MKLIKTRMTRLIIAITGLMAAPVASASAPVSVPEPETLGLFAIGITAVAIARKLRK